MNPNILVKAKKIQYSILSLVLLFLDLGKYVVLEDGVSRGKWSDWCDPSVVFNLGSNKHCFKLGSDFLHYYVWKLY